MSAPAPDPGRPQAQRAVADILHLPVLRALSERSLVHAGESLSRLLGHGVRLSASGVHLLPVEELPALVANVAPGSVGGLQFQITGEASGSLVILFPMPTIHRMLEALLGRSAAVEAFTEMERSAIREIGNVLASSFLSELGDLTQRRFLPSPPRILLDDLQPVMAETVVSLARLGPQVAVVQGLFEDPVQQIQGQFFILPEMDGRTGGCQP
ncbi:MAG: chemotaxis protein CheC [Candidatus Methylomirabilales bacterium]